MFEVFFTFTQFSQANLLAAMRKLNIKGTLQVTGIDHEPDPASCALLIPHVCSARTLEDAVDVTAQYSLEYGPHELPEAIWAVTAPPTFLEKMPSEHAEMWRSEISIKDVWDGPIATPAVLQQIAKAGELIFDLADGAWRHFPAGTFPRKKFFTAS